MKGFNAYKKVFLSSYVLLSVGILFFNSSFGQDTIMKRNNEKIIARITEVNPTEIKYNLFTYKDGPLFTLPKWELKFIVYGNGSKEYFDSVKPPVVKNDLPVKKDTLIAAGDNYFFRSTKLTELGMLDITKNSKDKRLMAANKKTRDLRFARKACSVGAVTLAGFGLFTYAGIIPAIGQPPTATSSSGRPSRRGSFKTANTTYRHNLGGYFMLAGLGSGIASVAISFNERKHAHLTVKIYNQIVRQ